MGTERSPLSERTAKKWYVVRAEKPDARRNEMKKKLTITLFTLIAMAIVVATWVDGERPYCSDNTIVVAAGDSAWLIAERECTGNIQNATDRIVKKYGVVLTPGQVIDLP